MLRDTNNIVQCRPSRLVCTGTIHYYFWMTNIFNSRSLQPSWSQSYSDSPHPWNCWSSSPNASSNLWHGYRQQPEFVSTIAPFIYRQHYTRCQRAKSCRLLQLEDDRNEHWHRWSWKPRSGRPMQLRKELRICGGNPSNPLL